MQYPITHSCGHTVTQQIYGTNVHAERDHKVEWLRAQPCRECQHAEVREQAEQMSIGWPILTGTPKQIAWAMTIRANLITAAQKWADEQIADWTGRDAPAEKIAELRSVCDSAIDRAITTHTDARWWIDHRNEGGKEIIGKHR